MSKIEEVKAELEEATKKNKELKEQQKSIKKLLPKIKIRKKVIQSPEKPLYPRCENDEFLNSSDMNLHYSQGSIDL